VKKAQDSVEGKAALQVEIYAIRIVELDKKVANLSKERHSIKTYCDEHIKSLKASHE
jgi:hypothetical protein